MNKEAKYWKEQYEELKEVVGCSIDQITIADGNGVFRKINTDCKKNFGIRKDKLIGESCFKLEDEGVFNISSTAEVLRKKQKVRFVQTTRAGKTFLVTSNPIYNDDEEIAKIINISTDITENLDLEKELIDIEAKLEWVKGELKKKRLAKVNDISSTSKNMSELKKFFHNVADKDILMLLLGETGVGKSHIAKYIHNISNRNKEPFVTVNCGAIPENLLESELFGYEKGSFTGASNSGKEGLFQMAGRGTIFLDEIGEMDLDLQVKLLTVLEDNKYRPVGGSKELDLKARILISTNKNLAEAVECGEFREDLYYRINILPIEIPRLGDRKEDIPPLVDKFLKKYNAKYGLEKTITSDAYEKLLVYDYPGNIRELKNMIERSVITSLKNKIKLNDIKKIISSNNLIKPKNDIDIVPLKKGVEDFERKLLSKVSKRYKTTREQAEILKVNQSTIVRKRKKYSI